MLGVMMIVLVVNSLLLFASGQFLNGSVQPVRLVLGSLFGASFAAVSIPAQWDSILWQLSGLVISALIAFGISKCSIPKVLLFCLLHFSLGGLTGDKREMLHTLLGSAGIWLACVVIRKERTYIPVELTYAGRSLRLTALRDTGNTLRDPVTGRAVLILDAVAAEDLTGLSVEMLLDPVGAMGKLPGLRLIPYQTVGNSGFLLALMIPKARIGNRWGSTLVAFSPQRFGSKYQALTGGNF